MNGGKGYFMTLGERLKRLRELAGLSQNELAKRARISRPIISALESDKQKSLTLDNARRLARALGVTLDMLAGEEEPEEDEPVSKPRHDFRSTSVHLS